MKLKIYEVSAGPKNHYLLVDLNDKIVSESYRGNFFDVFGKDSKFGTIWDRDYSHNQQRVLIMAKREIELSDLLKELKNNVLEKIVKGEKK